MLAWPNLGLLLKKGIAVIQFRLIYWQSPSILLLLYWVGQCLRLLTWYVASVCGRIDRIGGHPTHTIR